MSAGTTRGLLVALALLLAALACRRDTTLSSGSEWSMIAPDGATVLTVRVVKKEGDTLTLRMPFGTMKVKEGQVEILDAAARLIRLRDGGETSAGAAPK